MADVLRPVAAQLKYARILGGFPLDIRDERLAFSWAQLAKLVLINLSLSVVTNAFNIYGAWEGKSFFFYQEVFQSVGFRPLDFAVGVVAGVTSVLATNVTFLAVWLYREDLEKVCRDIRNLRASRRRFGDPEVTERGKRVAALRP
jgi:hypothetical protein